ncbi:hypothetical protein [Cellulomonas chengniuliangii]|uniref:Uncharacterized protein n=1 Tax=Cellulomonas chengniuliangii TaxID=2968084 RepID=A0ABY5KVV4_9CELL|nr:hypothetical protein [Cellulomonas chengniuliangii]MCC2309979.1 hypothetical protein [Cellulomonas chengniuliangii]UUI74622.1 hypothetical protein NP064_12570 [Cellulomonas chengniuliangii]
MASVRPDGRAVGVELAEHDTASVRVLVERLSSTGADADVQFTGDNAPLTRVRHAVLAEADSVFLLMTVTGVKAAAEPTRGAVVPMGGASGMINGMTPLTTIKVPRTLRDRLAARAHRENTTLAGALEHVLDETEEHEFWESVRASNAASPQDSLASVALRDNLGDPDDDAIEADAW